MNNLKRELEVEYEEAPSGAVKLYNYKEPFMPVKNGHGYLGVLMQDAAEELVQCHVCGDWLRTLARHIKKHNFVSVKEYKVEFGLSPTTSLVADSVRENMIKAHKKGNLNCKEAPSGGRFKVGHPGGTKISLEVRNLRGTCPLQLLDKLDMISKQLGHIPTFRDVKNTTTLNGKTFSGKGLLRSLEYVYGNWNNAVIQLGWTSVTRKKNRKWNRESLMLAIKHFYEEHNRFASRSDMKRKIFPYPHTFTAYFGSYKEARRLFINSKK